MSPQWSQKDIDAERERAAQFDTEQPTAPDAVVPSLQLRHLPHSGWKAHHSERQKQRHADWGASALLSFFSRLQV